MNYREKYLRWLDSNVVDSKTKEELKSITDEKEIEDRFYKNLEFGTAGLRGIMDAGSNRINIYTIAKATQALAQYLNKHEASPSICIAYDSRNRSEEFAQEVASVLAGNKVKVYLYEALRPVPMLSYAVRHMETSAGVVITASHNPKQYNGYKVYGSDGGQITDQAAEEILNYMESCDIFDGVQRMPLEEAQQEGLLEYMGEKMDESYYEKVESLVIRKDLVKEKAKDLSIIYTPIHGSGNIPIRAMLKRLGFSNVSIVPEQELPDGDFPTVSYPNPENKEVFNLAIELAKEVSPDLIFGTDPDCDRIGVLVKMDDGEYTVLTGNQVGVLLTDYILGARKEKNLLSEKDTVIKTVVSTTMVDAICKAYGSQVMDVLTGFKYIGEKIKEFNKTKSNNFVFGFEESYGYLAGDFVRDKDAVIASVLVSEMALYYQSQGKNLYEALQDLFKEHGYYKEGQVALEMKGKDGQEKIVKIISSLRENPPESINGVAITQIEDFQLSKLTQLETGKTQKIDLPQSNVMKFTLADGSWLVVRPSGTEPKMKVYIAVTDIDDQKSDEKLQEFTDASLKVIQA